MTDSKQIVRNLQLAPATLQSRAVTCIWEKPQAKANLAGYHVYCNDEFVALRKPAQTHLTLTELTPDTFYRIRVVTLDAQKQAVGESEITFTTLTAASLLDVTAAPYFADATGKTSSTTRLQQAIFDCPKGGTVLIPSGAKILSGALQLKSNITFQVDGLLQGSSQPKDYVYTTVTAKNYAGQVNEEGLILNRYEGWELYCYRSLLNSGYLEATNRQKITCENVRICGTGTIRGGGDALGKAMRQDFSDIEKYPQYVSDGRPGRRVRGRLLNFIQTKNIHLTGVHLENPPGWTVHFIYCDTVTTHGVAIRSRGVDNGDGWDPDSSRNCLIFDTTFDTGDDCIAIKSGKNPEGNRINLPTENVRIFDLAMLGGHGMAIGSEESGGVRNVILQDCRVENTLFGLELKAHPDRGGFIENVHVLDCQLDRFMAHSVEYNSDGAAAPTLPYFKNLTLTYCTLTGAGQVVELAGFLDPQTKKSTLTAVRLTNVTLTNPTETTSIYLTACENVQLHHVRFATGQPVPLRQSSTAQAIVVE